MDEVNPRLLEVFAPVARDLASAGLRATLRMEDWVRSPDFWTAVLHVDGQRLGGVRADPAVSAEGQVELLADQVQDYVLEFVRRGRKAVVWPRCRGGHPHPMVIDLSTTFCTLSWPAWICPIDHDYRILVGALDGTSQRSDAAPAITHPGTAMSTEPPEIDPMAGTVKWYLDRMSTEPPEIDPMATGAVRWYLDGKGFGVITRDGSGEDVFVLFHVIQVKGFKTLAEGQRVDFECKRWPDGRVTAVQVYPRP